MNGTRLSVPRTLRSAVALCILLVAAAPVVAQDSPAEGRAFRLIGVGDVMPGTEFPGPEYLDPRLTDGADPEAVLGTELVALLRSGDVVFGNMEGVLWDEDVPPAKSCRNPELCYAFRSPTRYANLLARSGFTVMALANNHSGDWGPEGRAATTAALSAEGIVTAGIDAPGSRTATLLLDSGIRVGIAAFSPNRGTLYINDTERAVDIVRSLAETHDVVLVSFHGGAEGSTYTSVPKTTEIFHGENRGDVYAFAHAVVDAGADIVLGHGPHVPRAVEIYRDRFIAYSLGNFWTYGRFNLRGPNGLAPIADLVISRDGSVREARVHSAKQEGRGGPRLDPEGGALELIRELTRKDLPEANLDFEADGSVRWPRAGE